MSSADVVVTAVGEWEARGWPEPLGAFGYGLEIARKLRDSLVAYRDVVKPFAIGPAKEPLQKLSEAANKLNAAIAAARLTEKLLERATFPQRWAEREGIDVPAVLRKLMQSVRDSTEGFVDGAAPVLDLPIVPRPVVDKVVEAVTRLRDALDKFAKWLVAGTAVLGALLLIGLFLWFTKRR